MWRDNEPYDHQLRERMNGDSGAEKISLQANFDALSELAPAGFSAGLHIRFASPLVYVRTYDEAWTKVYDENAYALRDPLVFWGLGGKGSTRWRTNRRGYIEAREQGSLFGQRVDVRCLHLGGPVAAQVVVALVVDKDEDDIRWRL